MNRPLRLANTCGKLQRRRTAAACFGLWVPLQLSAVAGTLQAGDQIWSGSGGNANWSNLDDWSGAAAPGSTASITNTDTATFSANVANKIVTIDSTTQDIGSILFDTASAAAYTIGGAGKNGGNTLLLSAGGSITVGSSVVNTETINAPLMLEGNYTFADSSSTAALVINGNVSAATATTLTINGASNASTTISGLLKDGAGPLAVAIVGGSLTLTPASSGSTFSGGLFVDSGTLILGNTTTAGLGTGPITLGDTSGSVYATFSTARQVTVSNNIVARAGSSGILMAAETNAGSSNNLTLSGTLTLGSAGAGKSLTVAAANGSSVTIAGLVRDPTGLAGIPGSLILGGAGNAGTVFLNAANTYTGPTVINAGTVKLGVSNAIPATSMLTIGSGATLNRNGKDDTVGGLDITAGTINGATATSFNLAGDVTAKGDGTNDAAISGDALGLGVPGTTNRNFTVARGATGTTADLTIGDAITNGTAAGPVSLTLAAGSTGILALTSSANTYSGGTYINGGTLRVSSDRSLGAVPGSAATNVTLDSGTLQWNGAFSLGANRSIVLGPGGGTIDLNNHIGSSGVFFQGAVSGPGGLTIYDSVGNNTLKLSATAALTYSGPTTIGTDSPTSGILKVTASNQLPPTTTLIINGGGLFDLNGSNNLTVSELQGSGIFSDNVGTAQPTLTVDDGNNFSFTGTFGSSVEQGSCKINLTKDGAGTMTMSITAMGTATYFNAGYITVQAGAINFGTNSGSSFNLKSNINLQGGVIGGNGDFSGERLRTDLNTPGIQWSGSGGFFAQEGPLTVTLLDNVGSSSPLVWGSTPSFVPNGAALILGANTANNTVTFTNDIDLNGAQRVVTINAGAGGDSAVLSGALSGSAGALLKDGNGTLVLSGANTYGGGTTIAAGTLQGTTTSLQGNIVNNALLRFDQDVSGSCPGVISGSGNVTVHSSGSVTLSGNNTFAGRLTLDAGTLVLSGSNGFTGGVTINSGTLQLDNPGALNAAAPNSVTFSPGSPKSFYSEVYSTPPPPTNYQFFSASGVSATINGLSTPWPTAFPIVQNAGLAAATLTVNVVTGGSNTFAGTMRDGGASPLSLVKAGAGTLTLVGTNAYTGGTVVSEGTLQLGGLDVESVPNTRVAYYYPVNYGWGQYYLQPVFYTYYAPTSFVRNGSIVGNAINNANLTFANPSPQTFAGNIVNNGVVVAAGAGALILNGAISGNGSLNKTASAPLVLGGVNSYSGGTTVSNGSLQGDTNSLQGTVVNNANVTFNQNLGSSAAGLFAGSISGMGNVAIASSSKVVIANPNSYSGPTSVAGTLQVSNTSGSATGTGSVSVSNGGTLTGTGIISGPIDIYSGGAIAPGEGQPGTIHLGDTNFDVAGIYRWAVNDWTGTQGTNYDLVSIAGRLTIGGVSIQYPAAAFKIGIVGLNANNAPGLISNFDSTQSRSWVIAEASAGIDYFAPDSFVIDTSGISDDLKGGAFTVSTSNGPATTRELVLNFTPGIVWTGRTGGSGAANSNWTTNTSDTNWSSGSTAAAYQEGRVVSFGDVNVAAGTANAPITNSTIVIQSAGVAPASVTFSNSSVDYILHNSSGNVGITGSTGIVKTGSGLLTLLSPNSFTGPVQILGGTVSAQSTGALGTSSALSVSAGASLELQGGVANGALSVSLAGTGSSPNGGALNSVSGINHLGGFITIQSGGATILSSTAGTNDYLVLTDNIHCGDNPLTFAGSGDTFIAGSISSTGTVIKKGSGSAVLLNLGLFNDLTIDGGEFGVFSQGFGVSGNLSVGASGVAGHDGNLVVDGACKFDQYQAGVITVGGAGGSNGTLYLSPSIGGASFTTGTGQLTINKTGAVYVGNGEFAATLNANGNVLIDGGVLRCDNGRSAFNLAAGKSLTIQNGGQAFLTEVAGELVTPNNTTYAITGANSKFDASESQFLHVGGSAQINVSAGGALVANELDVATIDNTSGTVTIAGAGSSASAAAGSNNWGASGGAATVTFSNGAIGTFQSLYLAPGSTPATTATLNIQTGANVSAGSLYLAPGGAAGMSAVININGSISQLGGYSQLTQSSSSTLTVGNNMAGMAAINIGSVDSAGGTFNSGTGAITINSTGTIYVRNGNSNANGDVIVNGGVLNVDSRASFFTMAIGKTLTLQNGGVLSDSGTFITGTGAAAVNPGSTISIIDGVFVANSDFTIDGGLFDVEGDGRIFLANGSRLVIQNGGVFSAHGDLVGPITLQTGGGTILSQSTGDPLALTGGVITNGNPLTFDGSGITVVGRSINDGGVLIKRGAGDLALFEPNSISGGVQVKSGTLEAEADGALGNGPLTVDSSCIPMSIAYLDGNQLIGGLSGAVSGGGFALVTVTPGKTLAINQPAGSATFAGSLFLSSASAGGSGTRLTKSGDGVEVLTGLLQLGNKCTLAVSGGTLRVAANAGVDAVGIGVTATISDSGTLELAGSTSPFSSGDNRVNIVNNSSATAGLLISGRNQVVGTIDGSGTTQVNAGSDLTADRIVESALIIGGRADSHGLVTIAASPQPGVWGVDGGGAFSDGANWVGGIAPRGAGESATFSTIITAPRIVSLDVDTTLGALKFDSATNYTITGPHALTLQAAGNAAATITVLNTHGNGAHSISGPITLTGDLTILQNSAGAFTISSPLDDSAGKPITFTGSRTTALTGSVNLGNGTVLSESGAGTLRFALAGGPATIGSAVSVAISGTAILELAGSVSELSSGTVRAAIVNNSAASAGILISGTNQQVGGIDGSGNLLVNAGSDLTANHIIQNALLIGGAAGNSVQVTIDASDASGNPLLQPSGLALSGTLTPSTPFGAGGISAANLSTGDGVASLSPGNSAVDGDSAPVPEPSSLLLILLAITGLIGQRFALRRRARRNDS